MVLLDCVPSPLSAWTANSFILNISLANAVILNQSLPDARSKRAVEVLIDYDTSVESVERILYAAALGAAGFKQIGSPSVLARKMERDGVLYEVAFTIADYADGKKAEHAVIKSILKCMRDAVAIAGTLGLDRSGCRKPQH